MRRCGLGVFRPEMTSIADKALCCCYAVVLLLTVCGLRLARQLELKQVVIISLGCGAVCLTSRYVCSSVLRCYNQLQEQRELTNRAAAATTSKKKSKESPRKDQAPPVQVELVVPRQVDLNREDVNFSTVAELSAVRAIGMAEARGVNVGRDHLQDRVELPEEFARDCASPPLYTPRAPDPEERRRLLSECRQS